MPGMQYVDAPRSQSDSGDSQKRGDVQDTGVLAAHEKYTIKRTLLIFE